MSSAAGSAAPSAHAGADGVSRRDIAALVYNYLRSNGFAKAAKQFRTDADALLAPFRNRVPTGVVGLERIVGEYVAIRARDDARRLAMDANPLARRMYEQLDDYAMHGGAGGVGGGGAAMRPGPGMTPSATAGGGRHSMANDTAVRRPRASATVRPILPAPTPEERERMAAAAAAAAAARADAAGPGPGSTAAARGTRPPPPPVPIKSPHKRKGPAPHRRNPVGQCPTGTLPAPPPPPPMGSLMDDAPGERGWRQYELPAELADQRIQERLAEYIVGFTGFTGAGGSKPASPTTRGGVDAVDGAGGSPNRAQAHARANAAERGVHLTDADVEELTCQLWDDEELGRLLGPLLLGGGTDGKQGGKSPLGTGAHGGTRGRGGVGIGADGTVSVGPSPLGARRRADVDAFADPPPPATTTTTTGNNQSSNNLDTRVGSKRRKGKAPAPSRPVPVATTAAANLPPELRGVDLNNLLDGIEY